MAPREVVKFVGGAVPFSDDGSPSFPYFNIESAMSKAPDGATLIFKANSENHFVAETLTINRPFTLKGANATIRKTH